MQKLQSRETQRKENKLSKKDGKKEWGGCNTCTRGPHRDRPCPGLEKDCFKCKEKGNFQNMKICPKRKKKAAVEE